MDFEVFRLLSQQRPSGTTAVTAYTKPTKGMVTIVAVAICNTTAGAVNASLYVDIDGTTYDQTTAIAYSMVIPANDTVVIEFPITLDTTNGTVGIQTSSANALTFTIIGKLKEMA